MVDTVSTFRSVSTNPGQAQLDLGRSRVPDNLHRQAEVRVREYVAHAADQAPRNLRRLSCDFVREVLRRFADDFEVADHRITRALVGGEGVVVHSGDEAPDLAAG